MRAGKVTHLWLAEHLSCDAFLGGDVLFLGTRGGASGLFHALSLQGLCGRGVLDLVQHEDQIDLFHSMSAGFGAVEIDCIWWSDCAM